MKTKYVNANVIGVICVLTACTARVGHAQGSKDRCSLLTQGAVSAAAGVSVDAGKPISTTGCSWQSEKPHVIVTVSFWGPAMNGVFTKGDPGRHDGAPGRHRRGCRLYQRGKPDVAVREAREGHPPGPRVRHPGPGQAEVDRENPRAGRAQEVVRPPATSIRRHIPYATSTRTVLRAASRHRNVRRMKRFILGGLALAACGQSQPAERYGFVARLGNDTSFRRERDAARKHTDERRGRPLPARAAAAHRDLARAQRRHPPVGHGHHHAERARRISASCTSSPT